MKILNFVDFIATDRHLLCAEFKNGKFGDITQAWVSPQNYDGRDFIIADLTDADGGTSSSDFFDLMDEAYDAGKPFPIDLDATCREGMYDYDRLFAVWDDADLKQLIVQLKSLLPEKKENNETD